MPCDVLVYFEKLVLWFIILKGQNSDSTELLSLFFATEHLWNTLTWHLSICKGLHGRANKSNGLQPNKFLSEVLDLGYSRVFLLAFSMVSSLLYYTVKRREKESFFESQWPLTTKMRQLKRKKHFILLSFKWLFDVSMICEMDISTWNKEPLLSI